MEHLNSVGWKCILCHFNPKNIIFSYFLSNLVQCHKLLNSEWQYPTRYKSFYFDCYQVYLKSIQYSESDFNGLKYEIICYLFQLKAWLISSACVDSQILRIRSLIFFLECDNTCAMYIGVYIMEYITVWRVLSLYKTLSEMGWRRLKLLQGGTESKKLR